jgi:UDP-N-acetylmuramoyl-L-alanyl-D-glutamate--2,6-diaminopimelate ligase
VFEVDEAALPRLVGMLKPRVLVLTNVFRDQLDRLGEPERAVGLLSRAAQAMPTGATVVANADDAQLWFAVRDRRPVGFGVTGVGAGAGTGADAEPATCPACGHPVRFSERVLGNLGRARCLECPWTSTAPTRLARVRAESGLEAIEFDLDGASATLPLGGVHNVPANPAFADAILQRALEPATGGEPLAPLPDDLEWVAHDRARHLAV